MAVHGPLLFLDLLSHIVMAMQSKQTVLIAAQVFTVLPECPRGPLIREAFYSAKKLEMPGGGGMRRGWWGGSLGKENGMAFCHCPLGKT